MNVQDARVILNDLLDKQYVDSILDVYEENEKIYKTTIALALIDIEKLQTVSKNQDVQVSNLTSIINGQKTQISYLESTVIGQNNIIKKQKTLKILGFIGVGILTIILIL